MLLFNNKYPSILINLFPVLLLGFLTVALWKNFLHLPSTSIPITKDSSLFMSSFFVFRALPFFLAGMWLRKHKNSICSYGFSKNSLLITSIFGEALSLLERNLFQESQFYLGTFITVGALFIYAIIYGQEFGKDGLLTYIGRELSLYIYILHIAIGKCFDIIAAKDVLENMDMFHYTRMFIVLVVSIYSAHILYLIKVSLIRRIKK